MRKRVEWQSPWAIYNLMCVIVPEAKAGRWDLTGLSWAQTDAML